MPEPDESRMWKYLELPQVFQMKAGDIDITHKQHLRICERLAKHLAKQRPKDPKDFEQVEYMKDFVMKSVDLSERTLQLLEYVKITVQEICNDATALKDGANLNRIIRDQGEKIREVMKERDEISKKYYDLRRENKTAV